MSEPGASSTALHKITRDPVSRRRFFAVTGTTGAAGVLLAACGDDKNDTTTTAAADDALAQFGEGDLGIVNYALTLEHLEAQFYSDVAASGLFKGDDLALIKVIGQHEQDHVDALTAAAKGLGGTPAAKPGAQFPLDSAEVVLKTAADVENLGASAYLGAAGLIESPDILAAALSIHTVEGRHAAALNIITGQPFTPDGAFAKPTDPAAVLEAVQPFLV